LFESLDSIEPQDELSFVTGGAAQSLVWIEQWSARTQNVRPHHQYVNSWCPGDPDLSFGLARRSRVPPQQDRSGVRTCPSVHPSSLLRPGKPFIFLLACKHWAGSKLTSVTMKIVGPTSRLDSNSPVEPVGGDW